ncbi:MAG TPA: class I SAM-dependent methyltransferase [Anaerolineales bacterium]|nr:class I SAM-dependent methyltransferase [Anaerolineales bacterium]
MNSSEFRDYKIRYRSAIRKVLEEAERGRLDESGFPAYSHLNPLINWLFWQRLRTAMNYIEKYTPYENILDFGCGSGVMLPFLAQHVRQVTAIDIDLVPLESLKKHIPLAENVHVLDANQISLSQLTPKSFDLINALDVLEHVDDLSTTLRDLLHLLRPGGRLLVSGPTENIFYQMGRKLAGPEFSGDYHERGTAEIKRELARLTCVRQIATLYWPAPLFEIFVAQVP